MLSDDFLEAVEATAMGEEEKKEEVEVLAQEATSKDWMESGEFEEMYLER